MKKNLKKIAYGWIPFISATTVKSKPVAIPVPIHANKKDWIFVDKGNYLYTSLPFSL